MKKYLPLLISLLIVACSNDSDPETDKSSFTHIYDSQLYNTAYTPIDIIQTPDGGYLVLASRRLEESNFSGVYIMKVDENGIFVSDQLVDEQYVNPVGDIIQINESYFFFCMTELNLQTQLVEVNASGEIVQTIVVGGTYPAAAAQDNANLLLLSYDNANMTSIVSIISTAGNTLQSAAFSVGAGDAVEEPIINHFLRTGRQFPFKVGRTAEGQYFFNGFFNYTFSLVFTDLNQVNGVVQGQQDDGGISQMVQLNGSTYSTARFNFGDNYLIPNGTLNNSGISSSTDLGGFMLQELVENAPVQIILSTINQTDVILFASNTKSGQIGIYVYEKATGEFLGSKYLGFSNPYEVSTIINTADEGVAIGGTSYVAGRFPRITIFKISVEELSKIF